MNALLTALNVLGFCAMWRYVRRSVALLNLNLFGYVTELKQTIHQSEDRLGKHFQAAKVKEE